MVFLREAVQSDMDLLFGWANDPVVRANSFTVDPIPYETHVAWFQRMMKDDSVLQYILMDGEIPVGQIRLNIDGEEAEIGYSIASGYRGKGYGRKMLRLILDKVNESRPEIKKLVAKVKPENAASAKLFESEGYDTVCTCYALETRRGNI